MSKFLRKLKKIIKQFFRFIWQYLNPLRMIVIFVICCLIISAGFLIYLMVGEAPQAEKIDFGMTFSQIYAEEELKLDWQKTYLAILDDLGVRKLRLVAYWSETEPLKNTFVFDDLDWQIEEARKRDAEVVLVIGRRAPRWPECHIPEWASELSEEEQQKYILGFLSKVIERYKDDPIIKYWQVENEPFLRGFGICPKVNKKFIDKEINLVKSLDNRPIILTTSGELSFWFEPALRTTIVGTTLYRKVWNKYLGYFYYPIRPVFYYKRAKFNKKLFGLEKIFVVELQTEPWSNKSLLEMSLSRQENLFSVNEFKKTMEYMRRTGLDEAYLWGAEWWYWLKTEQNSPEIWNEAKKLWR